MKIIGHLLGTYSFARRIGFLNTWIGQELFARTYGLYKRFLEDPYARLAQKHPHLFLEGHILDVGANIGYTAKVFASAMSPDYKVYAFEPEEFNFKMLKRTARSRSSNGRIIPIHAAVGDKDGHIILNINPDHHGDHQVAKETDRTGSPSHECNVPLIQLDSFAFNNKLVEQIAFIKIDVQGYEFAVCRGMRGILEKNHRVVVSLEYTPISLKEYGTDPSELLNEFNRLGFSMNILETSGDITPGNPQAMQAALCKVGYVNLLFTRNNGRARSVYPLE